MVTHPFSTDMDTPTGPAVFGNADFSSRGNAGNEDFSAAAAESQLNAQIAKLQILVGMGNATPDQATALADLSGARSQLAAAISSGNPDAIRAAVSYATAAATMAKYEEQQQQLAEANAMDMTQAAGGMAVFAVTGAAVLAGASEWRNALMDRLKASGEYHASLEGFGMSNTESMFNKAFEDIDKRLAAMPDGPQKDALLAERAEMIKEQVTTNERHTVEAFEKLKGAHPDAAAMAAEGSPSFIEQEMAGLPEGANKDALRLLKKADIIEMQENVAELQKKKESGEKLTPEMEASLAKGQERLAKLSPQDHEWLNNLTPAEKQHYQELSAEMTKDRQAASERDAPAISESIAKHNKRINEITGQGHEQGHETRTTEAAPPAKEAHQAEHPFADLMKDFPPKHKAALAVASGGDEHPRGDPPAGNTVASAQGHTRSHGAAMGAPA